MKKIITIMVCTFAFALAAVAAPYELVNDEMGYSYIKINEDLSSFKFTSDFKSIGNSGKIGFFIYPTGLEGQSLKDYIAKVEALDPKFAKKIKNGEVDLGALSNGDRVGFYLVRNNGDIIRTWNFQTFHNTTYIAFDKNGGGKDEWMSIGDITADINHPTGQPLPGALAIFLLGGAGIGAITLRRRKA